jgi:hypothetical protein
MKMCYLAYGNAILSSGDFSVNFDSNDIGIFCLYEKACFNMAEVSSQFRQASDSHRRHQPLHYNFLYSSMLWGECVKHRKMAWHGQALYKQNYGGYH